jgi:hypothetical protein
MSRIFRQDELWDWEAKHERLYEAAPSVIPPRVPSLEGWIEIDVFLHNLPHYRFHGPVARCYDNSVLR